MPHRQAAVLLTTFETRKWISALTTNTAMKRIIEVNDSKQRPSQEQIIQQPWVTTTTKNNSPAGHSTING